MELKLFKEINLFELIFIFLK